MTDTPAHPDYLTALLRLPDPLERFRGLTDLAATLDADAATVRAARAAAVVELRDAGRTWREVGDLLGVSAQRAQQLSQP